MNRRDERDAKKKKVIVLFMTGLMVISVFSVIFFGGGSSQGSVTENSAKFVRIGQSWSTQIDKQEARFTYLPSDVEDITLSSEILNTLKNTIEIDTTYDSNSTYNQSYALAQYQMGVTLQNFNIFVRSGVTDNVSDRISIITCNDSTPIVPVVYFKDSNETKISLVENCIIAKVSSASDAIRVKDRLLYGRFGIIK